MPIQSRLDPIVNFLVGNDQDDVTLETINNGLRRRAVKKLRFPNLMLNAAGARLLWSIATAAKDAAKARNLTVCANGLDAVMAYIDQVSSSSAPTDTALKNIKDQLTRNDAAEAAQAWWATIDLCKNVSWGHDAAQVHIIRTLGGLAVNDIRALVALTFALHQFFQVQPYDWPVVYSAMYTLYKVIADSKEATIRNLAFENTLFGFTTFINAYLAPGQAGDALKFAPDELCWQASILALTKQVRDTLSEDKTIYFQHAITAHEGFAQVLAVAEQHPNSVLALPVPINPQRGYVSSWQKETIEVIHYPAKPAVPEHKQAEDAPDHKQADVSPQVWTEINQHWETYQNATAENKAGALKQWGEKVGNLSHEQQLVWPDGDKQTILNHEQQLAYGDRLWAMIKQVEVDVTGVTIRNWARMKYHGGYFNELFTDGLLLEICLEKKEARKGFNILTNLIESLSGQKSHDSLQTFIRDAIESGLELARVSSEPVPLDYETTSLAHQAGYAFYQSIETLLSFLPDMPAAERSAYYQRMGDDCFQHHKEYNLAYYYNLRAHQYAQTTAQKDQACQRLAQLDLIRQYHSITTQLFSALHVAIDLQRAEFPAPMQAGLDNLRAQLTQADLPDFADKLTDIQNTLIVKPKLPAPAAEEQAEQKQAEPPQKAEAIPQQLLSLKPDERIAIPSEAFTTWTDKCVLHYQEELALPISEYVIFARYADDATPLMLGILTKTSVNTISLHHLMRAVVRDLQCITQRPLKVASGLCGTPAAVAEATNNTPLVKFEFLAGQTALWKQHRAERRARQSQVPQPLTPRQQCQQHPRITMALGGVLGVLMFGLILAAGVYWIIPMLGALSVYALIGLIVACGALIACAPVILHCCKLIINCCNQTEPAAHTNPGQGPGLFANTQSDAPTQASDLPTSHAQDGHPSVIIDRTLRA